MAAGNDGAAQWINRLCADHPRAFCLVAWVRGDTTLRNADGVPIIAARWRWPTPNELAEWHKAKSRSHG